MVILLVIANNLSVRWPQRSAGPLEANPPLIIYPNAVLAFAFALQRLKTIPRQRDQIAKGSGGFQPIELQPRGALDTGDGLDAFSCGEVHSSPVAKTDDHNPSLSGSMRYVKRNDVAMRDRVEGKRIEVAQMGIRVGLTALDTKTPILPGRSCGKDGLVMPIS
jgi:hypothetical protein